MLRVLTTTFTLLALTASSQAVELDLGRSLDEPGVRLVAVDFYAEHCQPCIDAVPRWEELRKRYSRDGLKLVVVNHEPNKPGCPKLPWRPDENICDLKGVIGSAFGFRSLPAAYLWSWQGNLLVREGHIEEVDAAIQRYLSETPKLLVEAVDEQGDKDVKLTRLFESKLSDAGKFEVVSDAATRQKLEQIRHDSRGASRRDVDACPEGQEVAANSLLSVERMGDELSVRLVNAVTGCQQGVFSPWDERKPGKSVAAAVHRLLGGLVRKTPELPGGRALRPARRAGPSEVAVRTVSPTTDTWQPAAANVINVKFDSEPAGARVTLDGEVVCTATPCKREVTPGGHRVAMSLARYAPMEQAVTLTAGQIVGWSLVPTFGTLSIRSEPSGVAVTIDGKPRGKTPLLGVELNEGDHRIAVGDRCYQSAVQEVTLPRGVVHTLDVPLTPRWAGIQVSAVDPQGDAADAEIFIAGEALGETPNSFKVAVCTDEVEVRHPTHGSWRSGALSLREKETTKLTAKLSKDGHRPWYSRDVSDTDGDDGASTGTFRVVGGVNVCVDNGTHSNTDVCEDFGAGGFLRLDLDLALVDYLSLGLSVDYGILSVEHGLSDQWNLTASTAQVHILSMLRVGALVGGWSLTAGAGAGVGLWWFDEVPDPAAPTAPDEELLAGWHALAVALNAGVGYAFGAGVSAGIDTTLYLHTLTTGCEGDYCVLDPEVPHQFQVGAYISYAF